MTDNNHSNNNNNNALLLLEQQQQEEDGPQTPPSANPMEAPMNGDEMSTPENLVDLSHLPRQPPPTTTLLNTNSPAEENFLSFIRDGNPQGGTYLPCFAYFAYTEEESIIINTSLMS